MSKKEYLRKKFLKLRKKNYFDINSSFFNPLISLLKKNGKKLKSISIYYPTNYEVNLLKIFQCNFFNSFEKLLPVVLKKNTMTFYKWNYKEILTVNKFGILEPLKNGKNVVPQVMILPLLSFDNNKNRLGYGKGYYDKFLNKYIKKNRNIITIGVAFSFQKYHKLPTSKFDVKLNFILTEKGLLR
jgi:5-formyltetrahydrofolate cyclo-ligase